MYIASFMGESFLCYVLQQSLSEWEIEMWDALFKLVLQKSWLTSCRQQMQCLKQILKKNLLHKFPEVTVPCQYFIWLSVNNYFYILWKWCTKIFTIFVGMRSDLLCHWAPITLQDFIVPSDNLCFLILSTFFVFFQ